MSGQRSPGIATAVALFAVVACALLPSVALAAPPSNDNYASAYRLNEPGTQLPRDVTFNSFTTAEATLQAGEPSTCGTYSYGATAHFRFYPDRPGILEVRVYSEAFLAVVEAWRFSLSDTILHEAECNTASLATRLIDFFYPTLGTPRVQEGQGYNVQIGGIDQDGGGAQPPESGPYAIRFLFYPDTDRDGWLDAQDKCPELGGTDVGKYQGCPDEDQDGFAEGSGGNDACPGKTGRDVSKHQGCPDDDGDNFPENGSDKCPGKTGRNVSKHQGCPDNDRDRVPEDGSDKCPGRNALKPSKGLSRNDKNGNGCPDVLRLHALVTVRKTVTALTTGVQLNYLTVKGVPNGSRVTCRIGRRACPRTPIRNSSTAGVATTAGVRARAAARDINLLGSTHLGFGTKIEIRVTAKYATGKVYRLFVRKGQDEFGTVREEDGCTNPGSRKFRAKGCR